MPGRIYSVGYEGFEVGALAERLAQNQVAVLVDVRLNAVSRRKGFSKRALTEALERAGVEYLHEKALGNPQENRDSFRQGTGEEGRARMRAILENGGSDALGRLVALANGSRIAVLCVERDRQRCHRDVITAMAVERDPSIEVVPIL